MKKSQNNLTDAEILRQKAEEQLKKQQSNVSSLSSENDLRKLAHELQVHQIELEMQYEQLKQAKEESDSSTQKYTELYEFAPSGYFTLTKLGEIIGLNLHGARLLGKEHLLLINRRFGSSVSDQTKSIFNNFLDKIFSSKGNESCEVTLLVGGKNSPTYVYLTGHTIGNDEYCQINAVDITELKKAEQELAQKNIALSKLNRFALELSNLSSDSNLETIIANQVKDIACADVAVFSEYESSTRTTTPKHVVMDSGLLEKVVNLLGKQIKDIHSVISDEDYRMMTTKMIGVYKTLYEASFGAIPRSVGAAIQALLNVDRIIGVAYIFEKKLFGTSLLLMGKGQPDPPKEILENFIQLASVSLSRKKAEQNLVESEEKYKAIYQYSNDAIMLLDRNGFFDYNPQTLKLFKVNNKEEFKKLSPIELSPPFQSDGRNSLEASEENIRIAYRDGYNRFEWIHQRANGEDFNADVLLSAFDYCGERVLQATVRDITERKQIEKKLVENESSLRNAQVIAQMGSWERDMVTQKTKWSNNYFTIIGFKPNEVEPTFELYRSRIHPDDVHFLDESLDNLMKDKKPNSFELRLIQPDGSFKWIQNNISPIVEDDKLVKLEGAIIDITKRKQSELELIKTKEKAEESDRLKTAFLSNMSHEIRTPMNGILGFTNLLKKPNLTGEEQQDFINIIQISGARMLNTVNNIVDISKIESGLIGVDFKETNIDEKIEFTYKFFKPEAEYKGLQFFFKNNLLSKETIIKTDNEKVYGILTNLIRNAIKFTYEGSIEFGYEKKGEYLEFFVKDTGIGIPENQKELIFERFRQGSESYNRNYEGSGLGLSISKSYVEMLGGSIWVESEEGKGWKNRTY
jgi:PAS domain S-box-containing protein